MLSKNLLRPRSIVRIVSLLYGIYFIFACLSSGCATSLAMPIKALILVALLCFGWGWLGLLLSIGFIMFADATMGLTLGHTTEFHGRSSSGRLISRTEEAALFWTTVLIKLAISLIAAGYALFKAWKGENTAPESGQRG